MEFSILGQTLCGALVRSTKNLAAVSVPRADRPPITWRIHPSILYRSCRQSSHPEEEVIRAEGR